MKETKPHGEDPATTNPDAFDLRIADEPGASPEAPLTPAQAVSLALDAARRAGGTLSRDNTPPELRGAVLRVEDPVECMGRLWRWIAWQAGAYGGAVVYTDASGRRLRFRLDCALARGGGYWYASHYDRGMGRTLNVYVGTHRSGAVEWSGLEEGARRMAEKVAAVRRGRVRSG